MLFDESERYFAPLSDAYYQQGDIVLSPVVRLEVGTHELGESAVAAAVPGSWVTRVLWEMRGPVDENLAALVRAAYVPAMIMSHDCTLDKEFNRRVQELRGQQIAIDVATSAAAADLSLDRYFTVAPIVPFEDAAPSAVAQLKRNQVIGFFPVCDAAELGVDQGVVDLNRCTTVDRDLILDRLAILTAEARFALRYALARFWVYRAPRLSFEVEEAVGKRIVASRVTGEATLEIELELNDGSTLRFVQAPSGDRDDGPERPSLSPRR